MARQLAERGDLGGEFVIFTDPRQLANGEQTFSEQNEHFAGFFFAGPVSLGTASKSHDDFTMHSEHVAHMKSISLTNEWILYLMVCEWPMIILL